MNPVWRSRLVGDTKHQEYGKGTHSQNTTRNPGKVYTLFTTGRTLNPLPYKVSSQEFKTYTTNPSLSTHPSPYLGPQLFLELFDEKGWKGPRRERHRKDNERRGKNHEVDLLTSKGIKRDVTWMTSTEIDPGLPLPFLSWNLVSRRLTFPSKGREAQNPRKTGGSGGDDSCTLTLNSYSLISFSSPFSIP